MLNRPKDNGKDPRKKEDKSKPPPLTIGEALGVADDKVDGIIDGALNHEHEMGNPGVVAAAIARMPPRLRDEVYRRVLHVKFNGAGPSPNGNGAH